MYTGYIRGTLLYSRYQMYMKKTPDSRQTLIFLALGIGAVICGFVFLWAASLRLPDFDVVADRIVRQSTKIYDRTGKVLLYDLHENIRRTVVPFDQISQDIKDATVAIEDEEFYEHRGIKITAFFRAVLVNLLSFEFSQGGSTITQQVVKNALLTQEKTIARKLKEWALSLKLEQELTKEDILSLYLNESPYGGSIYGIQEASQSFFAKNASEVTLAEAAYLAALPQAPTYYSPYGEHREALDARKNLVLERMLKNDYITQEEFDAAKEEVIVFQPRPEKGLLAPHFVFYVREYLEERYGRSALEEDGLRVITTLDYSLQETAEELVYAGALENEEKFKAENAGLVAVDPKTGEILVMVGSRDYFDENIDGNVNIATAKRQPGSAFKPFVYATSFLKGLTPETILFDLPTQFSTACKPSDTSHTDPCYYPENYDGKFRGPISIRSALAQSVNIPAVKALYLAGIGDSIKTARNMGISTLTDASRYGLTLVLGGGEVTLLDITSAYGVFANDGARNPTTAILRVERIDGTVLEESRPRPIQVLDKNVARQISDILSDNAARTPSFGANSALYFPGRDVAAKTGTTNDYRDVWIIGYTPNLAVGMWAGNNDNTPIDKSVAGFVIAPLWRKFMDVALPTRPTESFIQPSKESVSKPVLAGIWQGGKVVDADRNSTTVVQDVHEILHWADRDDLDGPVPSKPGSDPQYAFWEYPVRSWALQNGYTTGRNVTVPISLSETENPDAVADAIIRVSGVKDEYDDNDRISLTIRAVADDFTYAEIFINEEVVEESVDTGRTSIRLSSVDNLSEENTLSIIAHTESGALQEFKYIFSIQ